MSTRCPEAQRDRFLFKINVDYPSPEEEREIIYRMGITRRSPSRSWRPGDLLRLQEVAANNFVHHASWTTWSGVTATRRPEQFGMNDVKSWIAFGASPAPRWASSPPPGPWPWCAGATTSSRRTSSR